MGLFSWFSKNSKQRYEKAKRQIKSADVKKRLKIAQNKASHPEILYYLVDDPDVTVRRAVAKNLSTPVQASGKIAKDRDEDVRLALARRLVELLPGLSEDLHSQLYAFAVQALGVLAQDEVLKIRRALMTSLKDHACAPPSVVGKLARDVERDISEPILKCCVQVSDEDLLDILGHHPEPWVVAAIASREKLSVELSAKVVEAKDKYAGQKLLENQNAELSDEVLYKIIDDAREYTNWHEPLVTRKELSADMVRQIVGFVSETVLKTLTTYRSQFDAPTRHEITDMVKRRMVYKYTEHEHETVEQKVNRYIAEQHLTAEVLRDALAWGENDFVKLAISRLTGVHMLIIEKIFATGTAKPIVSLAWYAQFPARFAVELQQYMGHVQPQDILYAKEGEDYPLTEDEMKWQLEFFGVEFSSNASNASSSSKTKNQNKA